VAGTEEAVAGVSPMAVSTTINDTVTVGSSGLISAWQPARSRVAKKEAIERYFTSR
jgi:hypothetical protein